MKIAKILSNNMLWVPSGNC